MALGLKLTGLSDKNKGVSTWSLGNVSWWDERELCGDDRFKRIPIATGQKVYRAILTVEEAQQLNSRYKTNYLVPFAGEELSEEFYRERRNKVEFLESKLVCSDTNYVAAWIIEWEY
jgi:hypothetical protein